MPLTEPCIRMGPDQGPVALIILPLFEESNRLRRTVVEAMRALAAGGHASALPDLPGQNDSLIPTHAVTLDDWRAAVAAHVEQTARPVVTVALRGGCLIDAAANAAGHWRLAPVSGASLVRSMVRARVASEREAGRTVTAESLREQAARAGQLDLTGNTLSAAMVAQLDAAETDTATAAPLRSVTLGAGDGRITGAPLWLRAEPGFDATLAHSIADDVAQWMTTCAER